MRSEPAATLPSSGAASSAAGPTRPSSVRSRPATWPAPNSQATAMSWRSETATWGWVPPPASRRNGTPNASCSSVDAITVPSPAASPAWPKPRPSIAIAGAEEPGPPMTAGASNCDPTSRRATTCGPAPSSWRNTTQANEPSSSMSMSGEAPAPPAGSETCCGASETLSPVIRRAKIAPPSPHVATALPSADTATRECPEPTPAWRLGSTSSGCGTPSQVLPWRRTAATSDPPPPGTPNVAYAVPLIPMSTSMSCGAPAVSASSCGGDSVPTAPPGVKLPYTRLPEIQATTSRWSSPAATAASVASYAMPASTCSGPWNAPSNTRKTNTCATPPSRRRYTTAPLPSRPRSIPPTLTMSAGPSTVSDGNQPACADGAATRRQAAASSAAERRRDMDSRRFGVGGREVATGADAQSYGAPRMALRTVYRSRPFREVLQRPILVADFRDSTEVVVLRIDETSKTLVAPQAGGFVTEDAPDRDELVGAGPSGWEAFALELGHQSMRLCAAEPVPGLDLLAFDEQAGRAVIAQVVGRDAEYELGRALTASSVVARWDAAALAEVDDMLEAAMPGDSPGIIFVGPTFDARMLGAIDWLTRNHQVAAACFSISILRFGS